MEVKLNYIIALRVFLTDAQVEVYEQRITSL